ncbi:hypothetical protein GCM10011507_35170 [Edaphobacter acidisoli]|uniref:Uncharacterized protein n=1 Tax=Edaphobacter acidisoli TaxID=2040573 RepID=A0A916WAN1_9BACT|nr:hypothetical protein [Edaphobacter acidisoli]GGA80918.1 hypothetical protein GCM10011507_35170 [Edaphobacter acidisoli]
MAKTPKPKKHPKEMTTEEAIHHVFHPKIVKHLKTEVERLNKPSVKKG